VKCSLIGISLFVSTSGTYLMVVGMDGQELDHLYFFSKSKQKSIMKLVFLLLDVIKCAFEWMSSEWNDME